MGRTAFPTSRRMGETAYLFASLRGRWRPLGLLGLLSSTGTLGFLNLDFVGFLGFRNRDFVGFLSDGLEGFLNLDFRPLKKLLIFDTSPGLLRDEDEDDVAICTNWPFSSKKITVTASYVLGFAYGGNAERAMKPRGTRAKACTTTNEFPMGRMPPPTCPGSAELVRSEGCDTVEVPPSPPIPPLAITPWLAAATAAAAATGPVQPRSPVVPASGFSTTLTLIEGNWRLRRRCC